MRVHVYKYIANEPLLVPQFPSLAINKWGLPRSLKGLQALLDRDHSLPGSPLCIEHLRFLLTLLNVSRVLVVQGVVDYESITAPSVATDLSAVIHEVLETLSISKLKLEDPTFESYHLTTRSGPNGQALVSSLLDWSLLPFQLKSAVKSLGGESFVTLTR